MKEKVFFVQLNIKEGNDLRLVGWFDNGQPYQVMRFFIPLLVIAFFALIGVSVIIGSLLGSYLLVLCAILSLVAVVKLCEYVGYTEITLPIEGFKDFDGEEGDEVKIRVESDAVKATITLNLLKESV
jgi:hypothetical protein